MKTSSNLEEQVAQLSHRERARIALKLIESLDPGKDENVDESWLDECEARLAAYDGGKSEALEVADTVAEVERRLK